MPGLIGKKVGMTSIFSPEGKNLPCTVLEVGPCVVTQVKTEDVDGYNAIQLGWGEAKEKNVSKALQGHVQKASTSVKKKFVEFTDFEGELELGQVLTADLFEEGDYVDVAGTSKGKGFQGVVKRHGFAGVGQATHGESNICSSAPKGVWESKKGDVLFREPIETDQLARPSLWQEVELIQP